MKQTTPTLRAVFRYVYKKSRVDRLKNISKKKENLSLGVAYEVLRPAYLANVSCPL